MKSRIKELRAKYNLTQEQLANLVNVRRETIGHIENNKYNLSLILAYKISRALNSTIEEVFSFEENGSPADNGQGKQK
ncbi:MAG TPA: helix-turn-helix transcriptional regulator [Firmicutes bacterium]|nr:helix-turn-helix transcriptional regulator [Bacillota bacterium]